MRITTPTTLLTASLALTLTLSAAVATNAEAKTYKKFNIGSWNAAAHVSSSTGKFTHCSGSARYKSGIELTFSISRGQKWGVGFSKDSWDLKEGKQYSVRYQVDRNATRSGVAIAAGKKFAMIKLPGDSNLFAQMRRGRLLKVEAGNDLLKFSLKSTSRLLKSLLKCSVAYRDVVAASGNQQPFGSQNAGNSDIKSGSINMKVRWQAETRDRAQAVVDQVGVKATFIEPSNAPGLYVENDSVWMMGKYMGTMRVYPSANHDDIDEALHKSEKGKCDGEFQSRTKPTEIDGTMVSMRSAICKKRDGSQWSALYAIYPRTADSNYLFTIFTTKASLPDTLEVGEHLTKIAVRQSSANPHRGEGYRNTNF